MSFGFSCGFVGLILGCIGILAFCFETTLPIQTAGPMNMSLAGGDPLFTSIGLSILGALTWLGLRTTRAWLAAQGFLLAATAVGVVTIMALHSGNLNEEIYWKSDGRAAPADKFSFWLFSVPVFVLLATAWLRFRKLVWR